MKYFKNSQRVMFLLLIFAVLGLLGGATGCATPQEDYVLADEAAWKHYDQDQRLETWISWAVDRWKATEAEIKAWEGGAGDREKKPVHGPGEISPEVADALAHLNSGRKARISHAVSSVKKGGGS